MTLKHVACGLTVMTVVAAGLAGQALLTGSAAAQEQAASVSLRPQWQPGHVARYEMWGRRYRTESMEFGGQKRSVKYTIFTEGQVTWAVKSVEDDGSSVCTLTTDWLRIERRSEDGEGMMGDSRENGDNLMQGFVDTLEDSTLTFEVSPDGVIESVKGVEAINRKADNPDIMPSERDWIGMAASMATLPGSARRDRCG